ncbi:MAG TPA: type II toxin-antitoxin system VapC family toxin [Micromonosporaceae bacterium]
MIVLDASVLVAHLNPDDANHARAHVALLGAAEHPLAASCLTLAEVLVGPARAGRIEQAKAMLAGMEIEEISVGAGSAERLARLRAETGLRLPECCVLLAAQIVQADGVLTFDERLDRRAQQLGIGWVPPQPVPPGSGSADV